jgi:cellulose synthase/poly-beta-1,6-N-acetylglucosamine synthase-like glycosyltransferase
MNTTIVDTAAIVLCVVFLAYVLSIFVSLVRRRPDAPGDVHAFTFHLLIPCLDEQAVIERSVRRLRADHPSAHLWCIDDDSSDRTGEILAELSATDPFVHVVTRRAPFARQGKGAALNAAWRQLTDWLPVHAPCVPAERVVVGVVDADGRLAPDALAVIAGDGGFADPSVGAVQIQVRMVNRGLSGPDRDDAAARTRFGRLLVTLQDLEFRTVIAGMQHLRHNLGSAGMGGNGQFSRLSTLNAVAAQAGTPWHGALLEDFELGLHVLLAGARNRYCDDTWVAQEGLPGVGPLIRQRTRWAQGGMQCARYFRTVLTSRALSTPSALEIAYFLLIPWTQLLGTVVYTAAGLTMAWFALTSSGGVLGWLAAGGWGVIPLAVVFGVVPMAAWGVLYRVRCEPAISRRRALALGLGYWLYSYLMLASVWRAFGRMLRARNGWVKTERVGGVAPAARQVTRAGGPRVPHPLGAEPVRHLVDPADQLRVLRRPRSKELLGFDAEKASDRLASREPAIASGRSRAGQSSRVSAAHLIAAYACTAAASRPSVPGAHRAR